MACRVPDTAPTSPTRAGCAGFSLIELGVVLTIYGVLLLVLLDRLLYYQEAAEKARMEYTATTLKVALQVRIGSLMAEGQSIDYAAIARENPVSWLEQPPSTYAGEISAGSTQPLSKGCWYFDPVRAELTYVLNLDRYFQTVGGSRVRWHVQIVRPRGEAAEDITVAGLRFAPVEAYRWF